MKVFEKIFDGIEEVYIRRLYKTSSIFRNVSEERFNIKSFLSDGVTQRTLIIYLTNKSYGCNVY